MNAAEPRGPAPAPVPAAPEVSIAGFWRRLPALVVDVVCLGLVGWVLSLSPGLKNLLIAHPLAGLLLGTLVALAYEGLLDGPPGRGRTLGKRLLRLRVVGPDGAVPGWRAALARARVKYAYLLAELLLGPLTARLDAGTGLDPQAPAAQALRLVALLAVAGPVLVELYCYGVDIRGRQSLHDRVARTWVVRAHPGRPDLARPVPRPLWRGHYAVVAGLVLALAAAAGWSLRPLAAREVATPAGQGMGFGLAGMTAARRDLSALAAAHPEWQVRDVRLDLNTLAAAGRPPKTAAVIRVDTRGTEVPAGHVAVARALARRLLASRPELRARVDAVTVAFGYSFSLGIYSQDVVRVSDSQSPADWLADAAPKTRDRTGPAPRVPDQERA